MDKPTIAVQVVYAESDSVWFSRALTLPLGATLGEAIQSSGVLNAHPDWILSQLAVGIYGHRYSLDHPLADKDRVEIYRPLLIDPRVSRKNRVNSVRDKRKWRQINKNKNS